MFCIGDKNKTRPIEGIPKVIKTSLFGKKLLWEIICSQKNKIIEVLGMCCYNVIGDK